MMSEDAMKLKGLAYALGYAAMSEDFVPGDFSPAEWRKHAQVIRKEILKLKDRLYLGVDKKNPKAIRKLEHYEIALDAQLDACDQMCEMAGFLNMTYPDNRENLI